MTFLRTPSTPEPLSETAPDTAKPATHDTVPPEALRDIDLWTG